MQEPFLYEASAQLSTTELSGAMDALLHGQFVSLGINSSLPHYRGIATSSSNVLKHIFHPQIISYLKLPC